MGLSQNFLEDTYRLLTCSSDPPSSGTRLELEQLLRIAVQNLSLGLLVLCQAADRAQDDGTLASTSTPCNIRTIASVKQLIGVTGKKFLGLLKI